MNITRSARPDSSRLFLLSLLLAMFLLFLPLPLALSHARPQWLAMVLGYWALYSPGAPVIAASVLLGLSLDTLHDAPLGQHVLALTLVVYTLMRLRPLLSLYSVWQVTLLLLPVWLGYGLLLWLLDGMARHPSAALGRLLPAATTALAWPVAMGLLESLRGKR